MPKELLSKLDVWFVIGMVAQAAFTGRFLVQWLASERAGKSVIPIAFWYLSLFGGLGLLFYSIIRQDPLFILAQAFNSLIYTRNLMLIYRQRRAETAK